MGRWTQYDEDEYRLPEGMKRVGYDADTRKYYFRDSDGSLWQSAEGNQYGQLTQVSEEPRAIDISTSSDNEDLEAAPTRTDGYQSLAADIDATPRYAVNNNTYAYRTLFPFLLIIVVVLLLVIRLATQGHSHSGNLHLCEENGRPYRVNSGDTCWDISQKGGFSLDELIAANPGLECKLLTPSEIICLPEAKPTSRRKL
ncbi:hypothetical protein QCA50_002394 [Cerrena zonata]|uniref:LysM domain-containing protein n=1 Tax=Cerrena zonata TaxID=2478898 RepID=A0AAW0GTI9_9APHY